MFARYEFSYIYAVLKHHTYSLEHSNTHSMCYADFGSASSPRKSNKKITNVQFKRETCHAKELTITRKSLGLIWTGFTFNSLRQLLLKP